MGKLSKDRRDIYYRRAKEEGLRARSAYKLIQLNDTFNFFKDARRIVDLCAAPGSWSQTCAKILKENNIQGTIVAVDLQEMSPIEGVHAIIGDITSNHTLNQILQRFHGEYADLIICDGAPDVSGAHDMDEYVQCQLIFSALKLVTQLLAQGGTFVAKVFRGENIPLLFSQLHLLFDDVSCAKPASSRASSFEAFIVCQNYKGPGVKDVIGDLMGGDGSNVQGAEGYATFVACGDIAKEGDTDATNIFDDLKILPPLQLPFAPSYKDAVEQKKNTSKKQ